MGAYPLVLFVTLARIFIFSFFSFSAYSVEEQVERFLKNFLPKIEKQEAQDCGLSLAAYASRTGRNLTALRALFQTRNSPAPASKESPKSPLPFKEEPALDPEMLGQALRELKRYESALEAAYADKDEIQLIARDLSREKAVLEAAQTNHLEIIQVLQTANSDLETINRDLDERIRRLQNENSPILDTPTSSSPQEDNGERKPLQSQEALLEEMDTLRKAIAKQEDDLRTLRKQNSILTAEKKKNERELESEKVWREGAEETLGEYVNLKQRLTANFQATLLEIEQENFALEKQLDELRQELLKK